MIFNWPGIYVYDLFNNYFIVFVKKELNVFFQKNRHDNYLKIQSYGLSIRGGESCNKYLKGVTF